MFSLTSAEGRPCHLKALIGSIHIAFIWCSEKTVCTILPASEYCPYPSNRDNLVPVCGLPGKQQFKTPNNQMLLIWCTSSATRGSGPGPFFRFSNGSPLTRESFVTKVRDALLVAGIENPSHYAGHSFRIGAATTAAAAGVEDSIIKTLGRWESSLWANVGGYSTNIAPPNTWITI